MDSDDEYVVPAEKYTSVEIDEYEPGTPEITMYDRILWHAFEMCQTRVILMNLCDLPINKLGKGKHVLLKFKTGYGTSPAVYAKILDIRQYDKPNDAVAAETKKQGAVYPNYYHGLIVKDFESKLKNEVVALELQSDASKQRSKIRY
jgi:hypothetical protein